MDRENFYYLLELSVDPPEENPARIEEAIKKMQAQWSRFRNHPTKGLQAKGYIGLIPEIRRVMLDPELRRSEAEAAVGQAQGREDEKYTELDRHIAIHLSKGYVTSQEIAKLAELNRLPEEKVTERIKLQEEKKFEEIDRQLGIRMSKGFLTEEEVEKLAKLHGVPAAEIKKRVTCPIQKDGKSLADVQIMDKSIEKVILDNLKIVGKTSLYDFLELPSNASLQLLQKTAKDSQQKATKIGKKDAVVTATEILAGHCISIFRSEESRHAYDVSRGRSHLRKLDSDIAIAGMDGKIRGEYFNTLVKTAVDYGMDEEEAEQYILDYAKQKKIVIERIKVSGRGLSRRFMLIAAGAALLLLVGVAIGGALFFTAQQAKGRYEDLMASVEKAPAMETKQKILEEHLRTHEPDKFTQLIQDRAEQIRVNMEIRDLKALMTEADGLAENSRLDDALAVYRGYLSAHAGAAPATIKQRMDVLMASVEERDYKALGAIVDRPVNERLDTYAGYLRDHPDGKYQEEVRHLITNMSEEYYLYLEKELESCQATEDWGRCIGLTESYIGIYDNKRAYELKDLQKGLLNRQREEQILLAMDAKARDLGVDFAAARTVYQDYLNAYPGSSVQEKIEARIADINFREEQAREEKEKNAVRSMLASVGDRFAEVADGVVRDTKTGLMWTLLDSATAMNQCQNYAAAQQWVSSLSLGGFSDWRLPTSGELFVLYKDKPSFPGG
ncbi:MAG: DUF1566 domain-containing protein, partial [Proteobacteria bacterium]|nr:DUF1566 domain-containing protein [Pseudomonadota bacterium]